MQEEPEIIRGDVCIDVDSFDDDNDDEVDEVDTL